LIERSGLGGQAGLTVGIDNFPGFPEGISGLEFSERVTQQARRFDVEILQAQEVTAINNHEGFVCVTMDSDIHYHAQAVLVATGATYRRLDVPGEDDYIGAGIHFCATCDGPFYKDSEQIVVVGGGNSACEEGLHLTKFTKKVTMLVRGGELTASQFLIDKVTQPDSGIEVRYHTNVVAFEGQDAKLKTVKIENRKTGEREDILPAAAFIFIGQQPNSQVLHEVAELDSRGFVLTGHDLLHGENPPTGREPYAFETSFPGVFAAGDVRSSSTKQVASAVGEGAAASISIREFMRKRS
jgi:thioredoxin reductase (NADPH)